MKSVKLTKGQYEIFQALSRQEGAYLYKHVKPTGTICYRLLDKEQNPLANFREGSVHDLIEKGVLLIDNFGVVTKASVEAKR